MHGIGSDTRDMHDIELTLADVIRILYRRKLFLIALTLIFGACVTGWLLTLQPSYQSSSAVAVEDIGNRSGDLIGTVPVDALREIAEAPSTKRLVFEEAKRRQWLAEDAPFVQVLEVLSSQVRDVASGSRGAPGTPIQVLVLSAQMLDAKSSEELANVWAETLLTQVNSMYSKQTQDIIKAAAVYQETAEQRADLADMQLTSMTLRSLYESPEAVVSGLEEQLSALLQRALTVEAEIRDLQDERDVLVPRVSVQTVDGDWFGNVLTDTYLKAPDTVSSLLASLSSPTAQVARLLLWTLEEEEALQGYEFTSGLNAKKKELARVQGQLEGSGAVACGFGGHEAQAGCPGGRPEGYAADSRAQQGDHRRRSVAGASFGTCGGEARRAGVALRGTQSGPVGTRHRGGQPGCADSRVRSPVARD